MLLNWIFLYYLEFFTQIVYGVYVDFKYLRDKIHEVNLLGKEVGKVENTDLLVR